VRAASPLACETWKGLAWWSGRRRAAPAGRALAM